MDFVLRTNLIPPDLNMLLRIIDNLSINPVYKLLFMFIEVAVIISVAVIIAKVAISKHTYTCTECGHRFEVKWYWGASLGAHDNNQRYLKCPKCKKGAWCIIDKDD